MRTRLVHIIQMLSYFQFSDTFMDHKLHHAPTKHSQEYQLHKVIGKVGNNSLEMQFIGILHGRPICDEVYHKGARNKLGLSCAKLSKALARYLLATS